MSRHDCLRERTPAEDLLRVQETLEEFRKLIVPIAAKQRRNYVTMDEAFAAMSWLTEAGDSMLRLATYIGTDGASPQGRAN